MTAREKKFVEYWSTARKKWNWGKNLKKTILQFVLPLLILVDAINFFIIGDVNYGFISFTHLWKFTFNFLVLSVVAGFLYNFLHWNINEMRYWSIKKKSKNLDR